MLDLETTMKENYEQMLSNINLKESKDLDYRRSFEEQYEKKLQKCLEERRKEYESRLISIEIKLRADHDKRKCELIKEINEGWQIKLNNLQKTLIEEYESKIRELNVENESNIHSKEEEISRLQSIIEQQCER